METIEQPPQKLELALFNEALTVESKIKDLEKDFLDKQSRYKHSIDNRDRNVETVTCFNLISKKAEELNGIEVELSELVPEFQGKWRDVCVQVNNNRPVEIMSDSQKEKFIDITKKENERANEEKKIKDLNESIEKSKTRMNERKEQIEKLSRENKAEAIEINRMQNVKKQKRENADKIKSDKNLIYVEYTKRQKYEEDRVKHLAIRHTKNEEDMGVYWSRIFKRKTKDGRQKFKSKEQVEAFVKSNKQTMDEADHLIKKLETAKYLLSQEQSKYQNILVEIKKVLDREIISESQALATIDESQLGSGQSLRVEPEVLGLREGQEGVGGVETGGVVEGGGQGGGGEGGGVEVGKDGGEGGEEK